MKLTFKNKNSESVVFQTGKGVNKNDSIHPIINLVGLGTPETLISSLTAAFQDGRQYLQTIYDVRQIQFSTVLKASNETELRNKILELHKKINVKYEDGTDETASIEIEYSDGNIYEIKKIAVDRIVPAANRGRSYTHVNVTIMLTAYDPFIYGELQTTILSENVIEGKTFPKTYPFTYGQIVGKDLVFDNQGHVPTPIKTKFVGPSIDASLTNLTTNEIIEVATDLEITDELIVDTETKKVTKNGVSAYNDLTIASSLFFLRRGENQLSYFSGNIGAAGGTLTIEWQERYLGL